MVCKEDLEIQEPKRAHKNRKVIIIILFFAVCLIPSLLMGVAGGAVAENRKLSTMPSVITAEGNLNQQFFNEWDTYFTEHFAFRAQLVEANSLLQEKVFNSAADDQVILGKEGWLFFDQTVKDYMGRTLTDEEVTQIADQLADAQQAFVAQDKQLVVMIAPNKEAIYGEFMPDKFGQKSETDNYTALIAKLQEKGVCTTDLRSVLTQAKQSNQVYHKLDTHWNNTGALAALNSLYQLTDVNKEYTLEGYTTESNHEPDLEMILYPNSYQLDIQHMYDIDTTYTSESRIRSMDDITIQTQSDQGCGKSIVMYRDSFGRAIIPYVAATFDQATFLRATPYDLSTATDIDCDIVVVEIAERNIPDLLNVTLQ